MTQLPPVLDTICSRHKHPLLFATISGAHLYGFPSPDSDYDLRGVHVLPLSSVIGLEVSGETLEQSGFEDDLELDLVTHDVKKFMNLMLKKNGYVLEQLYSPLIVRTGPAHEELKEIGKSCITKHHSFHYLGFSRTQWNLFRKEDPPRVKPLLYVYRVLLTGIYLMRTGVVEANLLKLNEEFRLPFIQELVELKMHSKEKQILDNAALDFHEAQYSQLTDRLVHAAQNSLLPDKPTGKQHLNDLLQRVRLNEEAAGDAKASPLL
jgi:predicted nucleotidyltransferase